MDSAATILVTTKRNRTYRIWNRGRVVMRRNQVRIQSAVASRQASSVLRTPTKRKQVSQPLRRSPRLKRLHPRRSPRIRAMEKQHAPAKKVLTPKRASHRQPRVQNHRDVPVQPQLPQVPPTPRTLNRVVNAARVIVDAFPGVAAAPAPAQPTRRSAPYWPVNRAYVLVPRASAIRRRVPVEEDNIPESSDIDDVFAEESDSFEVDTDASGDFDPFEDSDDDA